MRLFDLNLGVDPFNVTQNLYFSGSDCTLPGEVNIAATTITLTASNINSTLITYVKDYSGVATQFSLVNKGYVDNKRIMGAYSGSAILLSTITVPLGVTMSNNSYWVTITPTSALAASGIFYISNKTTTTFQIIYPLALTGTLTFDWQININ